MRKRKLTLRKARENDFDILFVLEEGNISWVVATRQCPNKPAQLQRRAGIWKFYIRQAYILYFLQNENKDADQPALLHRLICAFVVRMQQS